MNIFLTGLITTFITLMVAAQLIKYPREVPTFFFASVVYGGLSVLPIPFVDLFLPPVGMYMVLLGSNYQRHSWVVKLCIVSFIVNVLMLMLLRMLLD